MYLHVTVPHLPGHVVDHRGHQEAGLAVQNLNEEYEMIIYKLESGGDNLWTSVPTSGGY